jgi:hypothetical protein
MLKAVLALALLGAAIYLLVRVVQNGRGSLPSPRLPRRFGRPAAPDDDPRFLRELDEQVWREKRQRQRAAASEGGPASDPSEPTTTTAPPSPPSATDEPRVEPRVEPDVAGEERPESPTAS